VKYLFPILLFIFIGCQSKRNEVRLTPLTVPAFEAGKTYDLMIIRTGGMCHRNVKEERQLLKLQNKKDISNFLSRFIVENNFKQIRQKDGTILNSVSSPRCECCGDITCELFHQKNLKLSFSIHHFDHIRHDGSSGDLIMTPATSKWVKRWLKQNKIKTE